MPLPIDIGCESNSSRRTRGSYYGTSGIVKLRMPPRQSRGVSRYARPRTLLRSKTEMKRNPTRTVRVGSVLLGSGHPVAVQSMCATRTQDVDATVEQAEAIVDAAAAVKRGRWPILQPIGD
mgnify:CR=1 FL=1